MFAIALLRSGSEKKGAAAQPYPVASVGLVRTCVGRPDGTSNLILEGVARVRVIEYVKLRPYRLARIEPLESFEEPMPPPREELLAAVVKLAKTRATLGTELPKAMLDSLLAVENIGHLSDLVTYALVDDFHQKQALLETLDINVRLGKLVELLQRQIQQFELWKTLQGKLSSDDVGKN
jgi:ATP-dependent Lon protease